MIETYRICTMPSGDWFVSSLNAEMEEKAIKSGGEVDGYDLGKMLELFGVCADDSTNDPHAALLKAIEADTQHAKMLEMIKKSITA